MAAPHKQTLESIQYKDGSLRLLDQRKLPLETVFDEVHTVQDVWDAIKEMRVRGAPAIAVSAALGLAVAAQERLLSGSFGHPDTTSTAAVTEVARFLCESCDYVITSRPTAVNLSNCLERLKRELGVAQSDLHTARAVVEKFTRLAEALYAEDVAFNEGIMRCGAQHILRHAVATPEQAKVRVMTICNPGALATARYGTALGVVRQLFYTNHLECLYACETRPWNQGARLTVYECVQEDIPCTLICDSAASFLMKQTRIDAVVVGADRICQNGDTANKIGTYNLAVTAKHHGVRFYVAAPSTTLDPHTRSGAQVEIEERDTAEITTNPVTGQRVVVQGPNLRVWNPVFDITPGELITGGIITEKGVFEPAKSAPFYDIAAILASPGATS